MSQRNSNYQRKDLDQYETPAWVTVASRCSLTHRRDDDRTEL
jgi:hypothetical protein